MKTKQILNFILSLSLMPSSISWAQPPVVSTATKKVSSSSSRKPASEAWAKPILSAKSQKVWFKTLKQSRVTTSKPITIKQLYYQMRPKLSKKERNAWFAFLQPYFSKRLLPGVSSGNKLFINKKGQSFVIEMINSPKYAYKINGVKFSHKDLAKDGGRSQLLKIYSKSPKKARTINMLLTKVGRMLPANWVVKASKKDQIKYYKSLRKYINAFENLSTKIRKQSNNKSYASFENIFRGSVWNTLLSTVLCSNKAHASTGNPFKGKPCVDAGWISKFHVTGGRAYCNMENSAERSDYKNLKCSSPGTVACHPLIFGTKQGDQISASTSGSPICVPPPKGRNFGTSGCNSESPANKYAEKIAQQISNDNNFVKEYTKRIGEYNKRLDTAIAACDDKTRPVAPKQNSIDGDINSACNTLYKRKFDFDASTREIIQAHNENMESQVADCTDGVVSAGCVPSTADSYPSDQNDCYTSDDGIKICNTDTVETSDGITCAQGSTDPLCEIIATEKATKVTTKKINPDDANTKSTAKKKKSHWARNWQHYVGVFSVLFFAYAAERDMKGEPIFPPNLINLGRAPSGAIPLAPGVSSGGTK